EFSDRVTIISRVGTPVASGRDRAGRDIRQSLPSGGTATGTNGLHILAGQRPDFECSGEANFTSLPVASKQRICRCSGLTSPRVVIWIETLLSSSKRIKSFRLRLLRYAPTRSCTSTVILATFSRWIELSSSRTTSIATLSAVFTRAVPRQQGQS